MIFSRELFFYLSKNYSFIYTGQSENLKARILESIITWSEMGQQTIQAKEVYFWTGKEKENTTRQFLLTFYLHFYWHIAFLLGVSKLDRITAAIPERKVPDKFPHPTLLLTNLPTGSSALREAGGGELNR